MDYLNGRSISEKNIIKKLLSLAEGREMPDSWHEWWQKYKGRLECL